MNWSQVVAISLGAGVVVLGCAAQPNAGRDASAPKPKSTATRAAKPLDQSRANVTQTYNENCANCHGTRGEGGGAGTKTLLTKEKFDQSRDKPFFDIIKNGVPNDAMPAFGETMSDEMVWAMVVHIRELQRNARREFDPEPMPDQQGVTKTELVSYRAEDVLVDPRLKTPWAIDWLPDGTLLVTNRPGSMLLMKPGSKAVEVGNLPRTAELGQGGLMQVKVHPAYARNGTIYLTLNDPTQDGRAGLTKLVRGKIDQRGTKATWVESETVFKADAKFYNGSGIHFGSKIVFDKSGKLYFNIGERGQNERSRPLDVPFGKVYRINDDGTAPADNPYFGTGNPISDRIWTSGHRNPQGLAFDLEGNLWDTEHAPRGGDELNLLKPGKDYGWPLVCFGINYNDSPFRLPWPKPGEDLEMPVYRWLPSCAASGLACIPATSAYPAWRGDLMAGGLAGQSVDRIRVKGGKLVSVETVWKNRGRVRDVAVGPDGYLYIVLNQPDMVVRLIPTL